VPVLTALAAFLPLGCPQVGPPVKLSHAAPAKLSGLLGPPVSAPETVASGVSTRSSVSVPVDDEGFVFGTHWNLAAPVAGDPAPFSTEHDSGPALVSVAFYLTSVNASPTQPVSVPWILIV
jgi:hypothetical protein